MAGTSCPPKNVWQKIIGDDFAEPSIATWSAHLDGCRACQAVVESLIGGQGTWLDIAAVLRRELPAPSAVCRRTLANLQAKPVPARCASIVDGNIHAQERSSCRYPSW